MRPLFSAALLTLAIAGAAHATVPLPDQPSVTDLASFRLECESSAATILLLDRTGKSAEATKLHARLWERYDAEVFARRAQAADLSLAVVNPWLTAAERTAAADQLKRAAAELTDLATFTMPDPATRDQFLEKIGRKLTDADRERAKTHLLLQKIRNGIAINQLTNRELAARRREVVARLEKLAETSEPIEAAITDARDLPLASEAVRSLAANFSDGAAVDAMGQLTADSFALDATLTQLIASDPANPTFWLARARGRWALGWRPAAVIDLVVASNFNPNDPGVLELSAKVRAVPPQVASIWQEAVDAENVQFIMRARRVREMAGEPPEALAPDLERTARAAVRNRARRLYACSFISKSGNRAAAFQFVDEQNSLAPGSFPVIAEELGTQFGAEADATGTDGRAAFAVHHRYAPLYGTTEAFWYRHVRLFIAANQPAGARVALEVASAMFPEAPWVAEFRAHLNPTPALPESEKK